MQRTPDLTTGPYFVNHYPHHIGDYAKDTMGLCQGEHGAYRLLMDAAYATECGIPADEVYGITRANTKQERLHTDRVLGKFFELRDGRYYQKRIDEEIAAYRLRAETARVNGTKGGRPPKRNPTGNPEGNPTITQPVSQEEPSGKLASSHKPIKNKSESRRAPKNPIPPDFGLSERVIDWAKAQGYDRLQEHLDAFRLKAVANGYCYSDWDAALMNAIRANWAQLAPSRQSGPDKFAGAL